MGLSLVVNGRERALEQLEESCSLNEVIAGLELKPDRVAVELNGAICSRTRWDSTRVSTGDRLEIVHFVGGGSPLPQLRRFADRSEVYPAKRGQVQGHPYVD